MGKIYILVKRSLDIVFAVVGLLLSFPLLIMIIAWIKIDSKGPAIFKQIRIGKERVPFKIFKFRTMVNDAEQIGKLITVGKDQRVTKCGYFLRKYKLDELPQLLNVLIGDMSFVGPRPEVARYVELYNEKQKQVLNIRPGITDLASIKYMDENLLLAAANDPEQLYINKIMQDKLELNLDYIRNTSIVQDIRIITQTIFKIINKGNRQPKTILNQDTSL